MTKTLDFCGLQGMNNYPIKGLIVSYCNEPYIYVNQSGFHAHRIHEWYIYCTYICCKKQPNVVKYTIHGSYGMECQPGVQTQILKWFLPQMITKRGKFALPSVRNRWVYTSSKETGLHSGVLVDCRLINPKDLIGAYANHTALQTIKNLAGAKLQGIRNAMHWFPFK